MSTTLEREVSVAHNSGEEVPPQVLDTKWAQRFSEAMAYGHGYAIDVELSDQLPTSMTSLDLVDHKIKVQLSRQLIERAETEDQLDFLGFNVLHELGHVKRFGASPPETVLAPPKDEYFHNIVDDIAINYDNSRKTRFFADLNSRAYDQYLFPTDKRSDTASEPRHKQFMEGLLLLAMTTNVHRKPCSPEALQSALSDVGLEGIDPSVVDKLSQVVNFKSGKTNYNLLGQIREYGEDLDYYAQLTAPIRTMYDELYEDDLQDKQQPGESGESDGDQSGDSDQFDYSNSGGCQHTSSQDQKSADANKDKPQPDSGKTDSAETKDDADDIAKIGKQIGKQIAEAIDQNNNLSPTNQKSTELSAEQLARLRQELGLNESDFQGFLNTVNKYRGEIAAITDLILQLRRERQDNFLAPSHEVSARGHRIHVGKLLGYLAGGSLEATPDIWKTPAFLEKTEYEFDGADFYFLCDVSVSMAEGSKAEAAAESAVVLSQGIQDASLDYYEDIPPVRIQVQAFGSGNQTICELTNAPSNANLGTMYSSLLNSDSGSTQVSGALAKIKPDKNRLSVVLVLSDGQFHDETPALSQGKRLEEEGAIIVQCVFGGANVSKLSSGAKRMNINGAQDLPNYLFGIMPELIDILRSTFHA